MATTALKSQLATVMADLSTMAPHMAGTEWHQDRVGEAMWLMDAIRAAELETARAETLEMMWRAATFA
jgi:hypothetical protein